MSKAKYKFILAILLVATIASGILSFVSVEQACGGIETTCYAVQTSQYESTFGVKNAPMGLVIFSLLGILTFLHIKNPTKYKKQIITLGIFVGAIFAIYFLYIQLFILNAICKYCMVVDIGMLLNLGVIILWKEKRPIPTFD